MQNTENKDKPQVKLLDTESIFNPDITITDEHWAVSFAKHSHASRPNEAEHGILIIQSHNKLYRREIFPSQEDANMCMVKQDTRLWDSPQEFERQVKQLIWKNPRTNLTPADLGQFTWSITSDQGMELLNDIEKDCETPPRFFLGGDTSLFKPREVRNRCASALASNILSVPISTLVGGISGAAMVSLAGIPTGLPEPVSVPPLIVNGIVCVAATTYLYMTGGALIDEGNYSRHHNCATWCVEKLTNLNIPAINKDLGFHFTDVFAYVTGLHVHKDAADKAATQALMLKLTTNKVKGCLNMSTVTKEGEAVQEGAGTGAAR